MVVALALSELAGRYYARAFGRVRGLPGLHTRRNQIKWLLVYPAMAAALVFDGFVRLPLLLSGIIFAGALEAYRRSTGGGRRHYVVASAVFAAATLAPSLGVVARGPEGLNLIIALLGATYVVGGVLDHFELRRILRPVDAGMEASGEESTVPDGGNAR